VSYDEFSIAFDKETQAVLRARAAKNGTSLEYEAVLSVLREVNRSIDFFLAPSSPSKGKQDD